MSLPILKTVNLNYSYETENTILKNITIDIFKGEKIAVLGSNGAGKSTFFLILNGVLTPDKGKIYYRENEINKNNLNELRKNIGIVFQDADNQIIASTVFSEVSFGPMNLGISKDEVKKRVEQSLEYMNLLDFKNRPPHYLSGGEKKRVSIADIIAMKSEIIIFDEPTASLDFSNFLMLEKVLSDLSEEGKTILISTHDIDFAYKWADRAIIFSNGNIIADGDISKIFKNNEIIKKANLNRPKVLEFYELLYKKEIIKKLDFCPKSFEALKNILL